MRIFLDTNILVSAFGTRGLCADLFEVILLEHDLVIGEAVLGESRSVLRRKMRLPGSRCDEIVEYLRDVAVIRVASSQPVAVEVDPDDALILGEAMTGHAEIFVTGDAKVQQPMEHEGMKILSPRGLWMRLRSRS